MLCDDSIHFYQYLSSKLTFGSQNKYNLNQQLFFLLT